MTPKEFMESFDDLLEEGEKRLVGDLSTGYRYITRDELEKERKNMIKKDDVLNFIESYVELRCLSLSLDHSFNMEKTQIVIKTRFTEQKLVDIIIVWAEIRVSAAEIAMEIVNKVEAKLTKPASYIDYYKINARQTARTEALVNSVYGCPPYEIERVIFNDPATIVFWKDGSKTVVKASNEPFDEEKGLAMAIVKKVYGNKGNYFNQIKKFLISRYVETEGEEE